MINACKGEFIRVDGMDTSELPDEPIHFFASSDQGKEWFEILPGATPGPAIREEASTASKPCHLQS